MKHIFSLLALSLAILASSFAISYESTNKQSIDIQDYVRQIFIRGVPYEETRKYNSAAVPILLDMLNDPMEEAHWANIAVVLEIIGNDNVVQSLIDFIERDPGGVLTRDNYIAKTSALMGLGYLINRTGNKQALNYLIQGTEPQRWEIREIEGIIDYHITADERNQDMSQYAILGLALSGHPEAAKKLIELQQPTKNQAQAAFLQKNSTLITEALDANKTIAKEGLINYYQHAK